MGAFAGEASFVLPRRAPSLFIPSRHPLTSALWGLALLASTPAYALCVTAPEANLRGGPGTHFEKSWEVFKFMPLASLGKKGKWFRVKDVDGDTHWIHRTLVSTTLDCAVVKAKAANVRSGPGTRYRLTPLGTVQKYYSFKVLSSTKKWVKVEDEVANRGWIAKTLLWIR